MDEQDETKTLEDLNYSITNSVYNLANTTPNFINSPSVNYSCNISSKMNDAIILSESYFMIEYKIVTTNSALLITNWFLSMLNSMNFNINSYSFQLNSIATGRTFPMLVQTLRYLQYEQADYSKYSKIQQEYFQDFQTPSDQIDNMESFRPSIFNPSSTTTGYIVLNLKDLIPVIDTINQCTGLLSFSFVLNYDPAVQSLSNVTFTSKAPTSFTIEKINFHYPIKTYNSDQVIDIDINYFKSLGILQGRNSQEQLININVAAGNGTYNTIGSNKVDVVVSNIQLSTNQIFKLLIFPVFTTTEVINPSNSNINYFSQDGNSSLLTVANKFENLGVNDFNISSAARNNYKRSIDYLLTPTGSIGSPLFGVTNLKVVVNGNTISPSNITPNYVSSNTSDYYQYFYGFDQAPINRYSKPNLFFNYNMYKNFSPIVVDISNATSKNAYNSLTFSYTLFNKFTLPLVNPLVANNIRLDTYYTVLNLQVLND